MSITNDSPGGQVWPFVESPAEFAERLVQALRKFDMLGAVRHVLIENPPALAARQPAGEPVTDAGRTVAYDAIDRFLRNNMDDATYAAYVEHLEALWAAVPAQETAKAVDLEQFRPFVEAQRNEYISHGLTSENACVAECDELLALIDSQSNSRKVKE